MRTLIALAVAGFMLAGCVEEPKEDEGDGLLGFCPQWVEGPGSRTVDVALNGMEMLSDTTELRFDAADPANGSEMWEGLPLDVVRLRFTDLQTDGVLRIQAFTEDGRQLSILDRRAGGLVPSLEIDRHDVDDGLLGAEFDIVRNPLTWHDGLDTGGFDLVWTLTNVGQAASMSGSVDVSLHHRVCGGDLP